MHTHTSNPSRTLTIFVILYMLVFSVLALKQGNTEFLMYALVMVGFISATMLLHLRVRFTPTALWLLALWGFLHMAGGTIPINPIYTDPYRAASTPDDQPTAAVLYALRYFPNFLRYDQIVHTLGFFSATVACYEATRTLLNARRTFALACIAALMGIGLGALNEVIEFIAVLTIPDTNVGGYQNTAWDLVANTVGSTLAGAWSITRKL
jgi:predicted membrane protein DUF2238